MLFSGPAPETPNWSQSPARIGASLQLCPWALPHLSGYTSCMGKRRDARAVQRDFAFSHHLHTLGSKLPELGPIYILSAPKQVFLVYFEA